jgi:hypothetical protein
MFSLPPERSEARLSVAERRRPTNTDRSVRNNAMTDCYFNYFTEVEEHFRAVRGNAFFMLSSRDWALLEAWKNAGIPLEAVLRGIDAAFEKWRKRSPQARTQPINSLYYCTYAIAAEAQAIANAAPVGNRTTPPFSLDEVCAFVRRSAAAIGAAGHVDLAASLDALDLDAPSVDLEQLEQSLTAIEEKMITRLREAAGQESLLEARRALERDLKPYRGKMTTDQLAMLEKQFLERRLLESAGLPQLSLLYL